MLKVYLLFNLLIFAGNQSYKFGLKEDLTRDLLILKSEHADYNKAAIENLKSFGVYANLSMAGFRAQKHNVGNHIILKWTRTGKESLRVYEVISVIPSDTVYQHKIIDWDSVKKKNNTKYGEKIRLKQRGFVFHTYIIKPTSGKKLVYMTMLGEGLHEYWIGKKSFYPLYESIALGIKFPDLPEILRLVQE